MVGAAFLALILFAGCGGGNSTSGGNNGGGGGGGVVTAVAVSPSHAEVASSGALQQFTATVSGDLQNRVSWTVDGTAGGNAALGTIDASGLYTPAATAGTHSITAASTVDSSITATATLSVQ